MRHTEDKTLPRRARRVLTLAMVVGLGTACAGDHPLAGTWRQAHGVTALPPSLGGDLDVDATLVLDGRAMPATFDLDLLLSYETLSDEVHVRGTYVATGSDLALTFDDFLIDPLSGNTSSIAADGSRCIVLTGFGGSGVCFPSPQTHAYTLDGDTLSIVLDNAIAGAPVSQTRLAFTRQ